MHRSPRPALGLLVAAAACRSAPGPAQPPTPLPSAAARPEAASTAVAVGELRARRVAVTDWRPAVPATEVGGACRTREAPPGSGGGRTRSLVFPDADHPVRNVSVTYSEDGVPRRYSDVRGDLRPAATAGPRTFVFVDFVRGEAHAMNHYPDRDGEAAAVALPAALDAAALDRPRHLIDLVQARCGAG